MFDCKPCKRIDDQQHYTEAWTPVLYLLTDNGMDKYQRNCWRNYADPIAPSILGIRLPREIVEHLISTRGYRIIGNAVMMAFTSQRGIWSIHITGFRPMQA